jgi:gamma-glutamylcyclotransferase (GGCT)/AIG2-like uncharacterized protein YtfP
MHVFTYGTLMFPEVWQAVVGRMFPTVEGAAAGYATYGVRGAVFPGMVTADEREIVRGVVYLDVEHSSLARLDLFEDDFYQRQPIWIDCDDGQRRAAEAYIVPMENQHILSDIPWDRTAFVNSGGLDHFIRRFEGFGRVKDK